MNLHSRLPAGLTLEERAVAINELFEKIYIHGQQTERLRWRVAVELHNARKLVPYGQWEAWCENNIRRGLRDIQKLLKMAEAHDPQAAHEAEKAARRVASRSGSAAGATVAHVVDAEQSGVHVAAWDLAEAILARFTVAEARDMLQAIDIHDLVEAVEAYALATNRNVQLMSTATH